MTRADLAILDLVRHAIETGVVSPIVSDAVEQATTVYRRLAARVVCRWITDDDRARVASALDEAADLVGRVLGRRPDMAGIPVEPELLWRARPEDCSAHVATRVATRRMRLRVNYAFGRGKRRALVILLAHELAHVVHVQSRADAIRVSHVEAERVAFAVMEAVASGMGATYRIGGTRADRLADPHWKAWKWCRDRGPGASVAWAREYVGVPGEPRP